jgi:hypothetical protein
MVQIEALPKDSATFGLIGYFWPKSVPLPTIGAVMMPAGSPVQIQTAPSDAAPSPSGRQINITATVFGGQKSAYGPRSTTTARASRCRSASPAIGPKCA